MDIEIDDRLLVLFGVLFAILVVIILTTPGPSIVEVCFDNGIYGEDPACVRAELANTKQKYKTVFSKKPGFGENDAVLFVFDREDKYPVSMKNIGFALDVVWLDRNRTIVNISKNTPPCQENNCITYVPSKESLYIIDLPANFTQKHGINKRTEVEFELP